MNPPFKYPARPEPAANSAASAAVQAKFQEGWALHQKGQLAQAQELYQEVLTIQPRHSDALHLMGVIAYQTNNPLQAVELIGRAIEINPDNAVAYSNRGNALSELKRLDEALDSYDRALKIKPDYADAQWNLSLCRLLMGDFARGWEGYEWRWKIKEISSKSINTHAPEWDGKTLQGSLLVVNCYVNGSSFPLSLR